MTNDTKRKSAADSKKTTILPDIPMQAFLTTFLDTREKDNTARCQNQPIN